MASVVDSLRQGHINSTTLLYALEQRDRYMEKDGRRWSIRRVQWHLPAGAR